MDVSYFAAFLVGLLGGVHCVGMCGGIVGALSLGLPREVRDSRRMLPYLLAYNLARITSYTLAGALLGGVGYLAAHWSGLRHVQLGLQLLAALFMIALGLYLAGWWMGLGRLERAGGRIWRHIEPLGRRFLPVRTPGQAFLLGLLWGWLPCGLVYSVLVWSISRGDAVEGGLLMLSFGLGTLPTLLSMGVAATHLSAFAHHAWVRRVAGILVMLFGVLTLYPALSG
jgi:sulfite exporter TauE/SafE